MDYKVKDFDYKLPQELIAQNPIKPRDHSRLLLLDKRTGSRRHELFFNIADHLRSGDVLVLNNSKVFPARLIGKKAVTKGAVEIFLLKKLNDDLWECLVGGRAKADLIIEFSHGLIAVLQNDNGDGTWQVRFNIKGKKFWETIDKVGLMPLPPYIKRGEKDKQDKKRYQTVFAADSKVGSVAAPTAGLHFTPGLLKKIKSKGVKIVYVTLHVGLGTFSPVKSEEISDHKMHSEFAEVSGGAKKTILAAKKSGGRIIAVGTTSCRTLESADFSKGSESFWTDIFIFPGYEFKIVDGLVTNFHLPKSTLLMLVSALAGKENIDRAYLEAVGRKYRFFSFGDAMLII